MGNSNSRPKISQVAPSPSLLEEEEPSCQPASPWMITAAQGQPEYQYGIVGHQHTSHLPPLKQHAPQIVHSLPEKHGRISSSADSPDSPNKRSVKPSRGTLGRGEQNNKEFTLPVLKESTRNRKESDWYPGQPKGTSSGIR
ncbi:hypothetical protein SRHO_G00134590 [Serrasalmus rhombeus]